MSVPVTASAEVSPITLLVGMVVYVGAQQGDRVVWRARELRSGDVAFLRGTSLP